MLWQQFLTLPHLKAHHRNMLSMINLHGKGKVNLKLDSFCEFDFYNKLEKKPESNYDIAIIRAIFDRKFLVNVFHSPEIHQKFPNSSLHNKCEIARLELIGAELYEGLQENFKISEKHLFFLNNFNEIGDLAYLKLKGHNISLSIKTEIMLEKIWNQEEFHDQIELAKEDSRNWKKIDKKSFNYQNVRGSGAPQNFVKNSIIKSNKKYEVFCNEFDEIIQAEKLASSKEINELQKQLAHKLKEVRKFTNLLALKFKRRLLSQKKSYWQFDSLDGRLNHFALAQKIIDPSINNIFMKKITQQHNDLAITLLIDNSGSMRGNPISIAAIISEILCQNLDIAGVSTEILGFTTKHWHGGESFQKWQKQDSPKNPGRLNDLLHIIYKSHNQIFQVARKNIPIMLKNSILKENIDGEALIWAAKRLAKHAAKKKILCVISDGLAIDEATIEHNSKNYLENHLQESIYEIEKHFSVCAIGIGVDLQNIYSKSVKIDNAINLPETLFAQLNELIL